MADYETILYEVNGTQATVTMNRPDNLNGINNQMMRELYACLNEVALDESVRVVLFTGAGRGFCPGVDLKGSTSGEPMVLLHAPGSEKMAAAICERIDE